MPGPTRRPTPAVTDGLVVLLAVVLPCVAQLRMPLQANDEGLLLLHPDAMARGLLPYRDFATPYGPLGFWVLQGVNAVFGSSLTIERIVGTGYHAGIALGVWALVRPGLGRMPALAAGLAAALVLLTVPPVALAWFGGVALAVGGFVVAAWPGPRHVARVMLAGVLVGLAAGYRPELAVLAVALLPAARGRRAVAALAGGVLVGLTPLFLAISRDPQAFLQVPLARAAVDSRGDLAAVGLGTWLCAAGCVAAGTLGLWRWRRLVTGPRVLVLATWLLLPGFAQRPDWVHLTFWACLGLPLLAGLVVVELRPWAQRAPRRSRWLRLAATAVVIGTVSAAALVGVSARGVPLSHAGRTVIVTAAEFHELKQVLTAVDEVGRPGDTLMVGPQRFQEPALPPIWIEYLFPGWRTTQYFREWIPGITEHAPDILVRDLERADVLVLVDLSQQARTLFPGVTDGPDTATRYVAENFCVAKRTADYEVLQRSPAAAPTGAEVGPCPQ